MVEHGRFGPQVEREREQACKQTATPTVKTAHRCPLRAQTKIWKLFLNLRTKNEPLWMPCDTIL